MGIIVWCREILVWRPVFIVWKSRNFEMETWVYSMEVAKFQSGDPDLQYGSREISVWRPGFIVWKSRNFGMETCVYSMEVAKFLDGYQVIHMVVAKFRDGDLGLQYGSREILVWRPGFIVWKSRNFGMETCVYSMEDRIVDMQNGFADCGSEISYGIP